VYLDVKQLSLNEKHVLQEDVETALACSDVTQLDVSAVASVSDDPQQALRLRIKRQTKFLNECRDMKARSLLLKIFTHHER